MKIRAEAAYGEFVSAVKSGRQILCYGAGLVALSIEDVFIESGIDGNVACFIDGDCKKAGTTIELFSRNIIIRSIDELKTLDLSESVLLLTLDVFGAVIDSLNGYPELKDLECYVFPMLNRSYIAEMSAKMKFTLKDQSNKQHNKIPRTIHYCWFGGGEIPRHMEDCIDSWSRLNPHFEIVNWNEGNYDVYQNEYMKQAHQAGKYAFVSDFARLDILFKYGGIYLDTDVLALSSFEDVLSNDAFIAFNEWAVPNSAISGSVAGNALIKEMRDNPRSTMKFINADGSNNLTNNSVYEARILLEIGFKKNFTYQRLNNITVYPPCVFPQMGRLGVNAEINEGTIAVHYAVGTWADKKRVRDVKQTDTMAQKLGGKINVY